MYLVRLVVPRKVLAYLSRIDNAPVCLCTLCNRSIIAIVYPPF